MAPLTPLEYLLLKYPKKPWDWFGISQNPNLTMEFVENNLEKYLWNWCGISYNKFNGKYYQSFSRWKKAIENIHEELLYSPYVMGIIV